MWHLTRLKAASVVMYFAGKGDIIALALSARGRSTSKGVPISI